jgi:hypothetical protein
MHGPVLADWQLFLRRRVQPPAPVTLPGPKARSKRRAASIKDGPIIEAVQQILNASRASKFQFEGAARHGIRRGFCLDGVSWAKADTRAAAIVIEALRRIGAVRPTWQEAAPGYADDRIERWQCKNCGRPVEIGKNGHRRQYCSDECLTRLHARMHQQFGHRQNRAEYLASCAANRELRALGERDCDRCSRMFRPTWRESIYCPDCRNAVRREAVLIHHDRPCATCGIVFKPRTAETKFCSRNCRDAAMRLRPDSTDCQTCGKAFVPDQVGRKFCCHTCFAVARRVTPEARCSACGTIFRPRNATKPNEFCSRTCANRSRSKTS